MHHIGTKRLDRYHELGQVGSQYAAFYEAEQQPCSRAMHCKFVRWPCLKCLHPVNTLALRCTVLKYAFGPCSMLLVPSGAYGLPFRPS